MSRAREAPQMVGFAGWTAPEPDGTFPNQRIRTLWQGSPIRPFRPFPANGRLGIITAAGPWDSRPRRTVIRKGHIFTRSRLMRQVTSSRPPFIAL